MTSLWGDLKKIEQVKRPEDILREQFEILKAVTEGAVIGRVEIFNRGIGDASAAPLAEAMQAVLHPTAQGYLGETKESSLTFEVFLTAKEIPNYQYRFMFILHGISPYPAKTILEDTIAEEIGIGEVSFSDSEAEYMHLLEKVLKSDRIMTIVSLLNTYRA